MNGFQNLLRSLAALMYYSYGKRELTDVVLRVASCVGDRVG